MPKPIPYLWFDGRAEQAAEHYVSIFPNSMITDVSRARQGSPLPEGAVITVSFTLDGQEYVGLNGRPPHVSFTDAVSFQIMCASQDEVDHYWDRLVESGEESQCGWLKDRFGVSWQVVPTALYDFIGDPDQGRAERATKAMLQMSKIDITELERAAAGAPS